MAAKVHILHPHSPPIGGFLRVGHTGHRKLEAVHAAGRFHYRRLVFDASARLGDRLKIEDEKVAKAVNDAKARLLRLRDALADLEAGEEAVSRSPTPVFRGGAPSINAALGQ